MGTIRNIFAARFTKLREGIGMTQESFAKSLGMSRQTIRFYESADRVPTIEGLDIIAKLTGCSVEYLMGRSENMRPTDYDFAKETGLTDEAIEALRKMMEGNTTAAAAISALIGRKEFPAIIMEVMRMAFYQSRPEFKETGLDLTDYSAYKASMLMGETARELSKDAMIQVSIKEVSRAITLKTDAQREMRAAYDKAFDTLAKWAVPPANSREGTIETALSLAQSFADKRRQDEEEKQRSATDKLTAFRRRMEGQDQQQLVSFMAAKAKNNASTVRKVSSSALAGAGGALCRRHKARRSPLRRFIYDTRSPLAGLKRAATFGCSRKSSCKKRSKQPYGLASTKDTKRRGIDDKRKDIDALNRFI